MIIKCRIVMAGSKFLFVVCLDRENGCTFEGNVLESWVYQVGVI